MQNKFELLRERYLKIKDPWGLDVDLLEQSFNKLLPFYRDFCKVRVFGSERVEDRPYIVVSNHSGQLPFDGALLLMSFLKELERPKLLRGMAERYLMKLPFLGELSCKMGTVLGDRKNCLYLLDKGESILAFPEGVRGISKSTPNFYQLQNFSAGFMRMALAAEVPILPVAIVGAEEFYPQVLQLPKIAKMLKMPAFPLSPSMLMGMLPMPTPVDIHIGKPWFPPSKGRKRVKEDELLSLVDNIQLDVNHLMLKGLKKRRDRKDHLIDLTANLINKAKLKWNDL